MKYVFLLILSCCIIAFSRIILYKYKNRVKDGEQFLSFLSFAYSEVSYSSITVAQIVKKFNKLNK